VDFFVYIIFFKKFSDFLTGLSKWHTRLSWRQVIERGIWFVLKWARAAETLYHGKYYADKLEQNLFLIIFQKGFKRENEIERDIVLRSLFFFYIHIYFFIYIYINTSS
jgi:hypothetical protein